MKCGDILFFTFYAPSRWEVPKKLKSKTKIIGMGKENAEKLAYHLNQNPDFIFAIFFGCAGALNPNFKAGDVFIISQLKTEKDHWKLLLPTWVNDYKKCSLTTSSQIEKLPTQKKCLYQKTGADLVDLEMIPFWLKLHPSLRPKVLLVRGVMDATQDPLSCFFIFKLIKNYFVYQRRMQKMLIPFLNEPPERYATPWQIQSQ